MPDLRYQKIQALIIDDFDSFRDMLFAMLRELGVPKIDIAANSQEALRLCATNTYDIIVCDQNLGPGKTGQQILEVLRQTTNNNSDSMFVLISAECNKNVILASFDHEPDDYLAKPITKQSLEQRLNRLLSQRLALAPIFHAIKYSDINTAIDLCRQEIASDHRYKNHCQKLLGNLLLKEKRLDEAEELYRGILNVRQLDWAMLGMAHVKKLKGDSLSAQQWLEEVIQFNPLCLKAYDLLADILRERGDSVAVQFTLQQAVEFSPLSILRQQALGEVALKNHDIFTAANAYRHAVKLGINSYYDSLSCLISFVHSAIQLSLFDRTIARVMVREAIKCVAELTARFGVSSDNKVNTFLLEAQLQVADGDVRKAKEAMSAAQAIINKEKDSLLLATKIEWVNALRATDRVTEAERITADLLVQYSASEDDLQKIDCLLDEPCSVKNKNLIEKINREGVALYEAKDFLRSAASFKSALQQLPKHIGLRLNLLQTLIALAKSDRTKPSILTEAQYILNSVTSIIPSSHAQFHRYRQLEVALKNVKNGIDGATSQ